MVSTLSIMPAISRRRTSKTGLGPISGRISLFQIDSYWSAERAFRWLRRVVKNASARSLKVSRCRACAANLDRRPIWTGTTRACGPADGVSPPRPPNLRTPGIGPPGIGQALPSKLDRHTWVCKPALQSSRWGQSPSPPDFEQPHLGRPSDFGQAQSRAVPCLPPILDSHIRDRWTVTFGTDIADPRPA